MKQKTAFKQTEIGKIPEDWTFEELDKRAKITMGQSPESNYYNSSGNGTLFLQGIRTFGKLYPKYDTWTTKVTKLAKKGSILLSVRAPVGEVNFADTDVCIGRGLMSIDGKNNQFIFYLFKAYKNYVTNKETGTVYGSVTRNDIAKLQFPFPNETEQSTIAKILSDLDSKIELNQQMNSTLEAIGQALFKRWFVDFEFPNEKGKPYNSSGGKMADSELGEVPKGWRVGSILDCADLLSGGTPKTEIAEYWSGDIPWVSAKDVTDAHGSFVIDTERRITQAGIDNSNAKLLPKNTTVVTARGTVGSYCILSREMAINQTNYGLKVKSGFGDFFIFFSISNLVSQMKQNAYGTIFDTITTKTFKEMKISIPPEAVINSFDDKVNNVMNKILHNIEESHTLAVIRDALLQKLMSGEIRVPIEAMH